MLFQSAHVGRGPAQSPVHFVLGGSLPVASSVTSTLPYAFMEWWLFNEMFLIPPWDRKDFFNLFCKVRLDIFVIFEVDCISEAFVTVVGGLL